MASNALSGAELKLARAKTSLILTAPFYATLALNMPWVRVEDDSVPTMATDGESIYWNPKFVDSMTLDETKFVVAHEVMHVVFDHMGRVKQRDPYNWNVATDFVINDLLTNEGFQMPKGGLHNPQLVQAGKGLAENVYDLLPPPPPQSKQGYMGQNGQPNGGNAPGQKGVPLDKIMKPKGSPAQQQAQAQINKVRVAQAAAAAKMCGKLSGNLERLVGNALKPKVDWKDVLRRFISVRAKTEWTYAKPKRRFLGDDLYLPSKTGETMGELVVAVDCSGSIGQRELDEFAAEIYAIFEDCKPSKLHVLYFDSVVSHHDEYTQDDTPKIVGHGGGGTAFSPIFKKIDERGIECVATVVLTDGYCSDYGPAPAYPVLWVTTGETKFPWGECVEMNKQ